MNHQRERLSASDIARLRDLVAARGVDRAAASIGVSSSTVCRALAALPLQGGTAMLLRSRLAGDEVPHAGVA